MNKESVSEIGSFLNLCHNETTGDPCVIPVSSLALLAAPPGNHIELYHNGILDPETVAWLLSLLSSTIVQQPPEAGHGFEFITVPQPFIPTFDRPHPARARSNLDQI